MIKKYKPFVPVLYSIVILIITVNVLINRYYYRDIIYPDLSDLLSIKCPSSRIIFSIDIINNLIIKQQRQTLNLHGDSITVTGWAVDGNRKTDAGGVYIDIDGRLFPASYGLNRPDVAKAFSNSSYQYSGFECVIPVSNLIEGQHTLSIKILTKDRKAYYNTEQKLMFNIMPDLADLMVLHSSTNFAIDILNGLTVNQEKQPLQLHGDSITVTGWAVDGDKKTDAGGVYIDIDGRLFPASYGLNRPDVAKSFNNSSYQYSGFESIIPVSNLIEEQHTLSIKILTKDRKAYYNTEQKLMFNIMPDLADLMVLHSSTNFAIDILNGLTVNQEKQPLQLHGDSITVTGWAVDGDKKTDAGGVYIDIDGRLFPASYGLNRPDVAKAFNNPLYQYSGFECVIPGSALIKGQHSLSIKILIKNQPLYYSSEQKIIFNISPE